MNLFKGKSSIGSWIVALTCLALGGGLFGLGYWEGQRSLEPEIKALTTQAMDSQRSPGNPAFGVNAAHPMPLTPPRVNIPANATPEMKEFLQNRATLMEKMAELRQQNPPVNGAPNPKLFAEFQQQNADLLKRQRELSQIIGQQQAKNPIPTPPPLQVPQNASPQLKTYLTDRDQLMRDQIAFMNQHRTDDPKTKQTEMQQWRQQNAARFQQLQQEAQAMAHAVSPSPTTPITPTNTNK